MCLMMASRVVRIQAGGLTVLPLFDCCRSHDQAALLFLPQICTGQDMVRKLAAQEGPSELNAPALVSRALQGHVIQSFRSRLSRPAQLHKPP